MKRIIWVNSGFLKSQLHQSARIMPAKYLASLGWDVTIITGKKPVEEQSSKIKFLEIRKNALPILGSGLYHLKVIFSLLTDKLQADVLFFQTRSAPFIIIIPIIQKYFKTFQNLKIVMDTRSVPMNTEGLRGAIKKLSFNTCHSMAKKLTVFQTAITQEMVNYVKIPKDKLLSVWESGVELEEFEKCYQSRKWPERNDPIKIIYIGTITKERNIEAAINAAKKALEMGFNIELNIVGSGPHNRVLKKLIKDHSMKQIRIIDAVDRKNIPYMLANNHIGLLPFPDTPKMRVSSALKMFEYLAAGMPIIATKIVAHTNVLKEKKFVFWATNSDSKSMVEAIVGADRAREKLKELGGMALSHAENFSWKNSSEKLSKGFCKLLKK
jgi:glycosyltransferase involved in cell wall biosynthesis